MPSRSSVGTFRRLRKQEALAWCLVLFPWVVKEKPHKLQINGRDLLCLRTWFSISKDLVEVIVQSLHLRTWFLRPVAMFIMKLLVKRF